MQVIIAGNFEIRVYAGVAVIEQSLQAHAHRIADTTLTCSTDTLELSPHTDEVGMKRQSPSILLAFLVISVSVHGQTVKRSSGPAPAGPTEKTAAVASTSTFLKATVHSSRSEVTIDGAYGIFADLENVSSVDITMFENDLQMVVQPEVTGSGVCGWKLAGWFPTEDADGKLYTKPASSSTTTAPETEAPAGSAHTEGRVIRLRPQEHYTVFWNLSRANTMWQPSSDQTDKATDVQARATVSSQVSSTVAPADQAQQDALRKQQEEDQKKCGRSSWFWWLNFTPGTYSFTIDAKFYLPEPADGTDYHTFTQTTPLMLKIPQLYSMWAAAFGSVLAFLVTLLGSGEKTPLDDSKQTRAGVRRAILVRDLLSAALLGAVITIVASRLADTQFPIKVSVSDIWGAVTVGFVSYFAGQKIIDRLKKL